MLPAEVLQLGPNGEPAFVEVDVRPAQTEGFTLADPECERHGPASRVPPVRGDGEDLAGVRCGERLHLRGVVARWLGHQHRVPGQVTSLDRRVERRRERPAHVGARRRTGASSQDRKP